MTTLLESSLASTKLRNAKTTMRDGHNRPIVVVTGMGVITSLGEGKTENWAKITAGESGIGTIRRFSTDGLKTRIAGTIDFVEFKPFSSTTLAERLADIVIEEAVGQSGIGRKGDFPAPLFLGGGLDDLGIRYGYQRFMPDMMLAVVVVLIALVQTVQTVGDYLGRRVNRRLRNR
jgi:hypothetical protein